MNANAPKGTENNPLAGAILTGRGVVHFHTTKDGMEVFTGLYAKACGGTAKADRVKVTTVGAVNCAKCIKAATKGDFLPDAERSNKEPITAGTRVYLREGFAAGHIGEVSRVRTWMYPGGEGITYFMGDMFTVQLWNGPREFNAEMFELA